MAFVSFAAHNLTAAGRSKALCGCFASFEFWHGLVLFGHKLLPYHVCGTFCKGDLRVEGGAVFAAIYRMGDRVILRLFAAVNIWYKMLYRSSGIIKGYTSGLSAGLIFESCW